MKVQKLFAPKKEKVEIEDLTELLSLESFIEDHFFEIDDLSDTLSSLESINEDGKLAYMELDNNITVVEKSMEDGGLSETGCKILMVGLASIEERTGYDFGDVPSIESYGEEGTDSTKTMLENLKNAKESVEGKLADVAKSIWKAILNFITMLTKSGRSLAMKAKKVEAAVNASKSFKSIPCAEIAACNGGKIKDLIGNTITTAELMKDGPLDTVSFSDGEDLIGGYKLKKGDDGQPTVSVSDVSSLEKLDKDGAKAACGLLARLGLSLEKAGKSAKSKVKETDDAEKKKNAKIYLTVISLITKRSVKGAWTLLNAINKSASAKDKPDDKGDKEDGADDKDNKENDASKEDDSVDVMDPIRPSFVW